MGFLKQYEVLNLGKLLQTVKAILFFFGSGKHTRCFTARRQDGCHAKPRHDITRYHQCWSGTDPIPRTNLLEEHRAKAREEKGLQRLYLKTCNIARLSILILSKVYPVMVYLAM
jgi:hypothetical protein